MSRTVRILGTHGVPAGYGGFETAAENIALYLVRRGWRVVVYCQISGEGPITEDLWNGIERVRIPVKLAGWKGTSKFDWMSIRHASAFRDLCLTFGYNTAVFNVMQRLKGIPNVINMDGIEWSRSRWGLTKQAILYINERIACYVGNHLIADHPEIEKYLLTRAPKRKITTLTYGADPVPDAPVEPVLRLGLEPGNYMTLIARPIPENSILEMVQGFSAKPRGIKFAILGKFEPQADAYHQRVIAAASGEVAFLGAIYDKHVVQALRFHSYSYAHGHTVGGTNPSLVEAMAAGNVVIAHDNPYNRWVVQDAALYFRDARSFSDCVDALLASPMRAESMRALSRSRFFEEFTWDHVAGQYERLLLQHLPNNRAKHVAPEPKTEQPEAAQTGDLHAAGQDFICSIEGLSITNTGLFVFGWAFSRAEAIESIALHPSSENHDASGGTGKLSMRRDDISALYKDLPRAAESGFYLFANLAQAQRIGDLQLVFQLASGDVRLVPLHKTPVAQHGAGDSASGSRRWMVAHAASSAWRMLKQRKFRAIMVAVQSKLHRIPKREEDAIGKVAVMLSKAGKSGCIVIIDHDLGGGANAYRERIVAAQLALGNAVALVTYHLLSVQWSIELVTAGFRERWALEDLDSIAHLANRGLVRELRYNTAVSFPNPIGIPILLGLMREIGGIRLTAVIHDYFPICPSHYLLNAAGDFCNIPDLATCRTCLAKHPDSYVALHRSRDIDAWRAAWGAFLRATDQITCFSEISRQYLLKAYPALASERVEVRPHTVDYLPQRRVDFKPDGPLRIGIVGKIGYSKGAMLVRDLAAEIRRRGIDARIVVIGTLEVAVPGRIVSETGRYQRHEFVDTIERSEANVFLFPSIWPETFSYVVEELMQLGVPLMCFNIGAPAERVRHYERGRVIAFQGMPALLDALVEFHKQLSRVGTTSSGNGGTVGEELEC